jgi:hypothetical protein
MNFRVYVPQRRWIPNEALVGLCERAHKRLGIALHNGIGAEELLHQAELEGLVEPVPDGSTFEACHLRYYTRAELMRLGRRRRVSSGGEVR